jgi:tetratricopeptide (TPR) repeat protein
VVRGHLKDPQDWVEAALAGADLAPGTRARLHYVAGWALLPRGHHAEAAARFDDAARLARETGMETDVAWALLSWAHAEVYRGRPARAAELLAPAREIAERHHEVHALSCVLIGDAHAAIALGSMAEADELLTAHLPDIEARGAPWPLAVALGDHDRAAELLTPAVRIFGDLGDTWGMAHQLIHVADVAALRGDTARATLLYGAVDGLADEVGTRVFHVWQELSDHCQARALGDLGVDRYTNLRRTGSLLTPAEVVDLATGRDGASGRAREAAV